MNYSDWRNEKGRLIPDPRFGHRLGRNYPAGEVYDTFWNILWLGTDEHGFVYNAGKKIDFELQDKNFFRIFLLGGSTSMGLGVDSNEKTIASQIEKTLRASNEKVRVVNCGVGSYMSWQQMSYLSLELVHYKPDLIIVLDGVNDFVQSTITERWIPNTHDSLMKIVNSIQSVSKPTLKKLIKHKLKTNKITKKAIELVNSCKTNQSGDNALKNISIKPESINFYLENIRSTIGIASSNGAKIIYLFQPQLIWGTRNPNLNENEILSKLNSRFPGIISLAKEWYVEVKQKFNNIKKELNNSNIWIEDASNWLDDCTDTIYHDWIHYNESGQKIIAENIIQIIKKMKKNEQN